MTLEDVCISLTRLPTGCSAELQKVRSIMTQKKQYRQIKETPDTGFAFSEPSTPVTSGLARWFGKVPSGCKCTLPSVSAPSYDPVQAGQRHERHEFQRKRNKVHRDVQGRGNGNGDCVMEWIEARFAPT